MENKYLEELKRLTLNLLKDEEVKIFVFGSRARRDHREASDVDIGLIPRGKIDEAKIAVLKEQIENSNIPYKVEIVNLSEASEDFKKEALKEVIIWKD